MLSSERKVYILKELEKNGTLTLKEVCEDLKTSESTIRRDFEELETQNKLKRVFGGAVKINFDSVLSEERELSMDKKASISVAAKKKLAKKCSEFIEDGECIFIDGGTTFMYLLPYLEGKHVRVVTHSDFIRLNKASTIELIVVGGHYLPSYQMNVGMIALDTLSRFNFDRAFIGCAALGTGEREAYTADMDSAQVKVSAMEKAIHTYLVADESKLDRKGFYSFAKLEDFDYVIMDQIPPERKKAKNLILCD